ncbi:MerR family transcriptional regulator [Methylobacterium iners]|uniref:MerR family transcriptional regulator n=1 Tax=Methylobacterium iners TaxID=418707 RepID=UPI001EE36538|nr:MerR family transcriptional regulator [Methylobacterium iners]
MSISINALSRQTQIKVPTIRYYERSGILPVPARTKAGCRTYTTDDVARLRFVHFGRSVGMRIGEVGAVLEMVAEGNCEQLDVMVAFTRERMVALGALCERLNELSSSIRAGELNESDVLSRLAALAVSRGAPVEVAEAAPLIGREDEELQTGSKMPVTKRKRAKSLR